MLTVILTVFTLIAFASNSVLCRMSLGGELIDPVSFTTVRLVSGALMLIFVSKISNEKPLAPEKKSSWISGIALFIYAITLSLAYISLDTGIGALIIFGAVQVTMIGAGLKAGERPHPFQWLGLIAAFGGIVYLVSPGISSPDLYGAFFMMISGIAWGIYSLRGKNVKSPVFLTTFNFTRAAILTLIISIFAISWIQYKVTGIILAVISGSITSGLGYVLWYKALRGLSTTKAAIVQLPVPVLASFGGVIFMAEEVSVRLLISSALILGGVALAILSHVHSKKVVTLTE